MLKSKSRASTPAAVLSRKVIANGRPGSVDSAHTSRARAQSQSTTAPGVPEWTTARWKLQVEAEARGRLKQKLRDVGSEQ
jgi:hypothetical protein